MITWKRDGTEMKEHVNVSDTVPTGDGKFQKTALLMVSPEERSKGQYTCEVTHKSGEPIVMTLTMGSVMPCQGRTSNSSGTEKELLIFLFKSSYVYISTTIHIIPIPNT